MLKAHSMAYMHLKAQAQSKAQYVKKDSITLFIGQRRCEDMKRLHD